MSLVDRPMTLAQVAASQENGHEIGQEDGKNGPGPIAPTGKARVSFNP